MNKAKWYDMAASGGSADVYIFGDITSMPWLDSDVSSHGFVEDLAALGEVDTITVHLNSYGGEVAEGIAIYNALRANQAEVTTVCEGMACSIASVVFMAGDERIMRDASMLYVHDCWTYASGDADDMRKLADDLDKQNSLAKAAYARSGQDEEAIAELMRNDTFLTSAEALEMGFATAVDSDEPEHAQQSALASVRDAVKAERATLGTIEVEAPAIEVDTSELEQLVERIEAAVQSAAPAQDPEPQGKTPLQTLRAKLNR